MKTTAPATNAAVFPEFHRIRCAGKGCQRIHPASPPRERRSSRVGGLERDATPENGGPSSIDHISPHARARKGNAIGAAGRWNFLLRVIR
jgi:hypothetical protein